MEGIFRYDERFDHLESNSDRDLLVTFVSHRFTFFRGCGEATFAEATDTTFEFHRHNHLSGISATRSLFQDRSVHRFLLPLPQ